MSPVCCPCCGLWDDWVENPLHPYCSEVCRLLNRYGLGWRINPCRIVVKSHPHLIVQEGPQFDLQESVLRGARERVLAAERKRRQRIKVQNVTSTEQYNAPIQKSIAVSAIKNAEAIARDQNG